MAVHPMLHPMSRRLRVDHFHLHRPWLKGTWYLDTLIAKVKSFLSNKFDFEKKLREHLDDSNFILQGEEALT
jgi:hypothetical protein